MILVCEPQCAGFEHVPVNSALLAVVRCAFPEEKVLFLAEKSHLEQVGRELRERSVEGVNFKEIRIPTHRKRSLLRLHEETKTIRTIYKTAEETGCRAVIFSSVTSAGLYAVKFSLKGGEIPTFIIPHGVLESIARFPHPLPWEFPFWFRFPLTIGSNKNLTYITLGESIRTEFVKRLPSLAENVRAIDHPYFFSPTSLDEGLSGPVCFGSFGVAHREKGSHLFFRLAEEISRENPCLKATFLLVGHIVDRKMNTSSGAVRIPSTNGPLSREEFEKYAAQVEYGVYFYPPETYRLRASGAFFDAVAFAKPIIALRNPFFDHYFSRFGDIGFLCEDFAGVKRVVSDLVRQGPGERYDRQRRNLLHCRNALSVDRIGVTLASIIGPQRRDH